MDQGPRGFPTCQDVAKTSRPVAKAPDQRVSLSGLSTAWCTEVALLLCCARTIKSAELDARIKDLLSKGMHWEYLMRMAQRHGVVQLLAWHLNAAHHENIPEKVTHSLREHFRANTLQNLVKTRELLELLDAFEAHGISAVPYKGPVLAAAAYGNVALRQFGDLDILVHRRDVYEAEEVLVSLGYRPQHSLGRTQKEAFLRSRIEHVFTSADGDSIVELHWGIAERELSFPLDVERLWERLEVVPLGGREVPIFSAEDSLLILCAHGSKHLWERLGWVCDVAELVHSHPELVWEQSFVQARALGGERMLLLGLFLARELLRLDLPAWVSAKADADLTVRALATKITERLFCEGHGTSSLLEDSYFQPMYLEMRERVSDKVRYCVRKATTQTVEDWNLLSLPKLLSFLYLPLRLVRLASKYGRRSLGGRT